jgi:hypothetical protein
MKARPIRIEGDVAYIPLTKGFEAVIDADDVPLVEGYNWRAWVGRNAVYAIRADYSGQKQRTVYLHRVIIGEPGGMQVDHIDSDGLNNRRLNLRPATHQQNNHNQRLSSRSTSGIKGVHWNKRDRIWHACIALNGKTRHLGSYSTKEAARAAYAEASARLHGEFGRIA